ncbi:MULTISPECIES: squalene/phytoene synthase family protein [Aphanothece]|uniref:squalene/phytoene synthase family protein n=1 Tax=Aphanothece TaxID=1121 RepID=UPI0039855E25
MTLRSEALETLKETSRTFYIPIRRLPDGLLEAVCAAYLCLRAIDEIEDHPELDNATKALLLRRISLNVQAGVDEHSAASFGQGLEQHDAELPEVSLRIGEWASLAPPSIAPRIWDSTAAMADRMAHWAECNWRIETESELNQYTFSVAGSVGLLLSDLWGWHDGTQTDRSLAIGFGRGLQAVNILRNQHDDISRGANFFPHGWDRSLMNAYANRNLSLADAYTRQLPTGPVLDFCKIPLTLAHGTLQAMALGDLKLSRARVMQLIEEVMGSKALDQE